MKCQTDGALSCCFSLHHTWKTHDHISLLLLGPARGPLEACVKTVFSFSPLTLSLLFLSSLSFILLKDCQIRKCRNDRPVVALLLFVSAMTACRPALLAGG